ARQILGQAVMVAAAVAALLTVPVLLTPQLLSLLDVDSEMAAGAATYVRWRAPSLCPVLIFLVMRGYLQAASRTAGVAWAVLAANVINALGDTALIFGTAALPRGWGPLSRIPAMGVAGAALATTLAAMVLTGWAAFAVRRVPRPVSATPRSLPRLDLGVMAVALKVGVPIGFHFTADFGAFGLAGLMAGKLGPASAAANHVAVTFCGLAYQMAMGLGNAGSVRVGRAVGAGDAVGARRAGWVALGAGTGLMSASALIYFFAPRQMAALISREPEVLALAVPLLGVAALFQVGDGLQAVGGGVLRGTGSTRFTFAANLVGHYGIGLPAAVLFGLWMGQGIVGIWWGLSLGLSAGAAALIWRFVRLGRGPVSPLVAGAP
ncbi:MAG TPA: MATE family efflux transporter, partial [Myxococcaceae bacterium]|nr:MATE family efflux transporter [Myxococcaceae bacterium]